jgi:hypothetical protein
MSAKNNKKQQTEFKVGRRSPMYQIESLIGTNIEKGVASTILSNPRAMTDIFFLLENLKKKGKFNCTLETSEKEGDEGRTLRGITIIIKPVNSTKGKTAKK